MHGTRLTDAQALAPSAVLSTSNKAGKRPAKAMGDEMEVEVEKEKEKEKEREAEERKTREAKEAEEARTARDAMLKTITELDWRGSIPNELHEKLTAVPEVEFPPLPEKGESADDAKKPKLADLLEQARRRTALASHTSLAHAPSCGRGPVYMARL